MRTTQLTGIKKVGMPLAPPMGPGSTRRIWFGGRNITGVYTLSTDCVEMRTVLDFTRNGSPEVKHIP